MNIPISEIYARVIDQWWGWAIGVVILLILVLLAAWITSGNKRFNRNYNSAMRIITDKLTNGEIDSEEYARLVKELQSKDRKSGNKAQKS